MHTIIHTYRENHAAVISIFANSRREFRIKQFFRIVHICFFALFYFVSYFLCFLFCEAYFYALAIYVVLYEFRYEID